MKNKKILIIALFLILFCLLGYSKSFASSIDTISFTASSSFSNDEKREYTNIKLPDGVGKYFVIDIDSNDYVDCFCSDNQIIMSEDCFLYSVGLRRFNCTLKDFINNTGWRRASVNGDYSYCNYIDLSGNNGQPVKVFTASNNILNADGTIFFRLAPQVQGIVAQQVETVKMSQVLAEIITLLPLILVVMVSLVGLRKGLKMLVTFLRQS